MEGRTHRGPDSYVYAAVQVLWDPNWQLRFSLEGGGHRQDKIAREIFEGGLRCFHWENFKGWRSLTRRRTNFQFSCGLLYPGAILLTKLKCFLIWKLSIIFEEKKSFHFLQNMLKLVVISRKFFEYFFALTPLRYLILHLLAL